MLKLDRKLKSFGRLRLLGVVPVIAVFMLLGACESLAAEGSGASSHSISGIEGVWEFKGGEIAVQKAASGKYEGTVVKETTFAECPHPVGQEIWREMTLQGDGSYWGLHQWYFEKSSCALNPQLGLTAWRVLEGSDGTDYLRVCFSEPGKSQPTIASNGTGANDSYGCENSSLTAPISSSATASFKLVSLPSAKKCLSVRSFLVHVHDPHNDAFKSVTITIAGKRLKATRHANYLVARVNLKGLPKGAFTLRISGVTVQGRHLKGSRTYHTCTPKRKKK